MDDFLRVLRIGCISVFAIIVLGVGSCAAISWLDAYPKSEMRKSLWARGAEILRQKRRDTAVVPAKELFGEDIEGICIVTNGPPYEAEMQKLSPAKFDSVIATIARLGDQRSTFGRPLEGDAEYSFVYAIKGGSVLRKYELVFRSQLDIGLTDGTSNRCYAADVPSELHYSPGDKSLMILVPQSAHKNRGSPDG